MPRKPKTRRHHPSKGKDYAPKPPPLDGTTYQREVKGHGWTTSRRMRAMGATAYFRHGYETMHRSLGNGYKPFATAPAAKAGLGLGLRF